jgi:hypothetical protein
MRYSEALRSSLIDTSRRTRDQTRRCPARYGPLLARGIPGAPTSYPGRTAPLSSGPPSWSNDPCCEPTSCRRPAFAAGRCIKRRPRGMIPISIIFRPFGPRLVVVGTAKPPHHAPLTGRAGTECSRGGPMRALSHGAPFRPNLNDRRFAVRSSSVPRCRRRRHEAPPRTRGLET